MNPLEYHPAVQRELDAAFQWYEARRPGLGTDFLDAVQRALQEIQANPGQYGFAEDDIREGAVDRFPYAIYYRELPHRVRILSVHHTSRDPAIWRGRS